MYARSETWLGMLVALAVGAPIWDLAATLNNIKGRRSGRQCQQASQANGMHQAYWHDIYGVSSDWPTYHMATFHDTYDIDESDAAHV